MDNFCLKGDKPSFKREYVQVWISEMCFVKRTKGIHLRVSALDQFINIDTFDLQIMDFLNMTM